VNNTNALCERARDAAALLFTYPRDLNLVGKYIDVFGEDSPESRLEKIVWLGPRADFEGLRAVWAERRIPVDTVPEQSPEAQAPRFVEEILEESGCAEYEMLVQWHRHRVP